MHYCVIVTFGNSMRDQKYVSNVTKDEAETHQLVAVGQGYRDAKVWLEKAFDALQRGQARDRAYLRKERVQQAQNEFRRLETA